MGQASCKGKNREPGQDSSLVTTTHEQPRAQAPISPLTALQVAGASFPFLTAQGEAPSCWGGRPVPSCWSPFSSRLASESPGSRLWRGTWPGPQPRGRWAGSETAGWTQAWGLSHGSQGPTPCTPVPHAAPFTQQGLADLHSAATTCSKDRRRGQGLCPRLSSAPPTPCALRWWAENCSSSGGSEGRNRFSPLEDGVWWSQEQKQALGPPPPTHDTHPGKKHAFPCVLARGPFILPGPLPTPLEKWSRQDPQSSHTSSSQG